MSTIHVGAKLGFLEQILNNVLRRMFKLKRDEVTGW
jgi:hypothetical protein